MKIVPYSLLIVVVIWSSSVSANTNDATSLIFHSCASSFITYTKESIKDESAANRFQHLDFHCAASQLAEAKGYRSIDSNLLAAGIVAAQELTNLNPNYKELTLGLSLKVKGFSVHLSSTWDGHLKIQVAKRYN